METFIFLLSLIIGLICIVILTSSDKSRKPTRPLIPSNWTIQLGITPPVPANANFRTLYPRTSNMPTPFHNFLRFTLPQPATTMPRTSHQPTTNELPSIQKWKKSIVGLIMLADHNLRLAKTHHSMANFNFATQYAATAVENISRALIHCYGEKPEINDGQIEPLRLLSLRMDETERKNLEEAITHATHVHVNTQNMPEKAELNPKEALEIIESASKAVSILKEIIVHHFAAEIPELNITCPKCQSLDLFNLPDIDRRTKHKCVTCNHEWTSIND